MGWKPLAPDAKLDGDGGEPGTLPPAPGTQPLPDDGTDQGGATGTTGTTAGPRFVPMGPNDTLDQDQPDTITAATALAPPPGAPPPITGDEAPIVITGPRHRPGTDVTPTYSMGVFGDQSTGGPHSALTDEQKADYAKMFQDRANPPTPEQLEKWYHDATGAGLFNARAIIDTFKKYGHYSTSQTLLYPTDPSNKAESTLGGLASSIPFANEINAVADVFSGDKEHPSFSDPNHGTFGQLWAQNADIRAAQEARQQAEHPGYFLAGKVGGTLATAPLFGEGAGLVSNAIRGGEEAGFFGKNLIGQTAQGAAQGASDAGPGNRFKGAMLGGTMVPTMAGALAVPFGIGGAAIRALREDPSQIGRNAILGDVRADAMTPEQWAQELESAQANKVPAIPADVGGPNISGRMAAVTRVPGEARTAALADIQNRQLGMSTRIVGHIQDNFGPVVNPLEQIDNMNAAARAKAAPLYEDFHSQPAVADPTLENLINRDVMKPVLKHAYDLADWYQENPKAMGMRLDENGNVVLEPATQQLVRDENGNAVWKPSQPLTEEEHANAAPNRFDNIDWSDDPKDAPLETRNVIPKKPGEIATNPNDQRPGWKPKTVAIRGPLDTTQFLRSVGGVNDAGGDLAHMGVTNKARDIPFGQNEGFLGPIIRKDGGLGMDEAARMAWEEGYFPDFQGHEHGDLPGPDDLISRLADESFGHRYFRTDDLPEVAQYGQWREGNEALGRAESEGRPYAEDTAQPATEADIAKAGAEAPPSAGRQPVQQMTYTPKTIDYVKRALDDLIDGQTADDGTLSNIGNAMKQTKDQLVTRGDQLWPQWQPARDAWGGEQAGKAAFNLGLKRALGMPGDELNYTMRNFTPYENDMARVGGIRAAAVAASTPGNSADVVRSLIGSDKKYGAVKALFGNSPNFDNFVQTLNQERQGFQTYKQAYGGSDTARNLANDLGNTAIGLVGDSIKSGSPVKTLFNYIAGAAVKKLQGQRWEQAQQSMADILRNPDPDALRELGAQLRAESAKRGVSLRWQDFARAGIAGSAYAGIQAGYGPHTYAPAPLTPTVTYQHR